MAVMNKMLMAAGSSEESSYWISLAGTTRSNTATGVVSDSNDNVYAAGIGVPEASTTLEDEALLYKWSNDGTLQFCRGISNRWTDDRYHAIAIDSSDNVYAAGDSDSDAIIAKYNSSGTSQFFKSLSSIDTEVLYSAYIDSGNNLIVAGSTNSIALIAKYNSSGAVQWQRTLTGSGNTVFYGVSGDSSDNYIAVGVDSTSGGALIVKYNSSGVLQWQRKLGTSTDSVLACVVDSSGNSYVAGYTNLAGNTSDEIVFKYNSSGVLQWQKTLTDSGQLNRATGIALDSGNNIYVSGTRDRPVPVGIQATMSKYSNAGVLQFQRTLDFDASFNADDQSSDISIDSKQNVLWCGKAQNNAVSNFFNTFVAKLPRDGSLTGTYGPAIYAVSTMTPGTSTLTSSTSTLTDSASTLTEATETPAQSGQFNFVTIQ
jgi:hypothetical protein|tara:strand:- start:577 stop:1860 length:1284 start_codon:yes stop_codon:yes gene_type:complete